MDQPIMPENTKRILSITFILILISTFVLVVVGSSAKSVYKDIKKLDHFVSNSEGLQVNFEESLRIYTERTKVITDYLLSLRPEKEQQYIKFISDVEELGRVSGLNLNLQSTESTPKALDYTLTFDAGLNKMNDFIRNLEKLPYLILIEDIDYTNPVLYTTNRGSGDGNVKIKIKLYIK